jgi:hypothetical protein
MSFQDKLTHIEQLQAAIASYGKLPADVLKRVNYTFRLDWNYYSNSMEGNSLTPDETRSVMIDSITVNGKPFRDIVEMRKHDKLITGIIGMGKGELNISEKRIKDIHAAILYEEDAEKSKKTGQWKNESGAPEKIHALVDWVNAEKDKISRKDSGALHPVHLAFQFYLDYVSIHPFYDGNGRTSRILCNLILLSYGYPPINIKTTERGDPALLYDLMADMVIRSQEMILKGIVGKSISDANDPDIRLQLLEAELNALGSDDDILKSFSKEVFFEMYDGWLDDLVVRSVEAVQKFNNLFKGVEHSISVQPGTSANFSDARAWDIVSNFKNSLRLASDQMNVQELRMVFRAHFGTFKKGGLPTFGCSYGWEVKFDKTGYEVIVDRFAGADKPAEKLLLYQKPLHRPLSAAEIDNVASTLGDTIFTHIEENIKLLKTSL